MPFLRRSGRLLAQLAVALAVALLSSCGGGGGGGDGSGSHFRVSWTPSALSFTGIEGYPYQVPVFAAIDVAGVDTLYLVLEERNGVVADANIMQVGNGLDITLVLSTTIAAGVHNTELLLHACTDDQCTRELPGSPARLRLRYEAKPQIKIQAPIEMRRVGREAAPSQTLALDFRPEMGTPTLRTSGAMQAFDIALQGNQIAVNTKQMPAGRYVAQVEVTGSADPLYRALVEVPYVVEPPPGGELPLAVTPGRFELALAQGTTATYRFKLQRPTWTDALDAPVINRTAVVKSVRDLGNDEYEFTVDTRDVPVTTPYYGYDVSFITVRAGPTGGEVSVTVVVTIDPPVRLGNPTLSWFLTASSTLADLQQTTPVLHPAGAAVRWTASSDQPWFKLLRSTGITGVDDLLMAVDPSVVDVPGRDLQAKLMLSVDTPGTQPYEVTVPVVNRIPRFDMASPGTLIGSSARVRIHGKVEHGGELVAGSPLLQVQGATLVSTRLETDPRFVGFVGVLAVDLANVVPGQPVTIRVASAIAPTQVVLQAAAAPQVPAGYAPLPFGTYRPPSYAPGRRTLVFAGRDAVWRWPLGAGWGATQSIGLGGLVDVTVAPDESALYASVGPLTAMALDPGSLAVLRQADWLTLAPGSFGPSDRWDTGTPPGAAALRFGSDGRGIAALMPSAGWEGQYGKGVAQVGGCLPVIFDGIRGDLALGPCAIETGTYYPSPPGSPVGVVLARSAHGEAIAVTYNTGATKIYRGMANQFVQGPSLAAGRSIVAVSDSGDLMVRDDGAMLHRNLSLLLNLQLAVPSGHTVGGYGLTGAGRFALVYGYRVAAEAGGPRARDAALYMVDLRGPGLLQVVPTVAAVLPLPDSVGCTAALVSGEACVHTAHVTAAPGDASAFVLGPRGVAAVTLADPPVGSGVRPQGRVFKRASK